MKTFLVLMINNDRMDTHAAEIRWQRTDGREGVLAAYREAIDLANPDNGASVLGRIVRAADAGEARMLTGDRFSYVAITGSFTDSEAHSPRSLPAFDVELAEQDEALETVARRYLDTTLERKGDDRSDFLDLGKTSLRNALEAAYRAGRKSALREADTAAWRETQPMTEAERDADVMKPGGVERELQRMLDESKAKERQAIAVVKTEER
jgi:hypothetical protein